VHDIPLHRAREIDTHEVGANAGLSTEAVNVLGNDVLQKPSVLKCHHCHVCRRGNGLKNYDCYKTGVIRSMKRK
jgi:hypothetical protein